MVDKGLEEAKSHKLVLGKKDTWVASRAENPDLPEEEHCARGGGCCCVCADLDG